MGVEDVLRLRLKLTNLPKLDSQNLRQGCTGFGGVTAHPATSHHWPLLAALKGTGTPAEVAEPAVQQ